MSGGVILFIDAYDSFSNNIISLLREELGVRTETIKIDDPRFVLNDDAFFEYIRCFDAIVAGPGPGHPTNSSDIGLIGRLWQARQNQVIPTLGICLGFQSLCAAYGAQPSYLKQPRHGIVTNITHNGQGMFGDLPTFAATQYHSLHMRLDSRGRTALVPDWSSSDLCPHLEPLAWDLTDEYNGPILMAVQVASKPYTGVQFHPESICTSPDGRRLIRNWWLTACGWNASMRGPLYRPVLENGQHRHEQMAPDYGKSVQCIELHDLGAVSAIDIAEQLQPTPRFWPLILQSGTRKGRPLNPETGRFSIVGFHDDGSTHFRYSCEDNMLITAYGDQRHESKASIAAAFERLESYLSTHRIDQGPDKIPFWGGLVGYTTYEAGLETIAVMPSGVSAKRHDLWFVFVQRSVVIDHVEGVVYVQSIRPDDGAWLEETARLLRVGSADPEGRLIARPTQSTSVLKEPLEMEYRTQVIKCQKHLRAGCSYELCLTDQTTLYSEEDSWSIYRRLSMDNPAPFSAYMQLQDVKDPSVGITTAGSSPERFLSWSRSGRCQFRPIKGTVSKTGSIGRKQAEAVLRTQKEMAENLMIVDLIRHDLAGVTGVRNVRVPSLMAVEEYETVFQLVSVIEGDLDNTASGVAVLAASLPPGSMTGAPKKRSCEILRSIEKHAPRGLYSGVLGYMDVGGGGDFSVVIRTAFQWHDDKIWRIGAGGAVTILSTPEGEYDEMLVKRQRVLDVLLNQNV